MATARDYCLTALAELGVVDMTKSGVDAAVVDLTLGLLNRIIARWNADRRAVWSDAHAPLASLTAGLNPHTIGPTGTFTAATARPVSIEGIRLTDDAGETFGAPLTPRSADWWRAQRTPGATAERPTDFYYDPTWPNGSIYFYPEPSSASIQAEIAYRVVLPAVALGDTVSMPQGYEEALVETLKEKLTELPMFASMASAAIKEAALLARGRAFGNNTTSPVVVNDLAGHGRVYDHTLGPFSLMDA